MRYVVSFCLLLLGLWYTTVSLAAVYRCTSPEGRFEFRDRPCQSSLEKGVLLAHIEQKTQAKTAITADLPLASVGLSAIEQQKVLKKEARVKKRAEQEILKTKRRENRCLKTQEKIKTIQDQLRLGCKLRRCNRLKEQINHFELMKLRYCEQR